MKILPLAIVLLGFSLAFASPAEDNPQVSEKSDVPPAKEQAKKGTVKEGKDKDHGRAGKRMKGFHEMNDKERGRLMFFRHLIMERYDADKNGRLSDEEKASMRKDPSVLVKNAGIR